MKKSKWGVLAGITLSMLFCVPAMAQTTGIAVDGRTYVFTGSEGTYEADGKSFVIGTDTVTIKEPGKDDRVLTLSRTSDSEAALTQGSATFVESTAGACYSAETYGEITVVEDSQLVPYLEQAAAGTDSAYNIQPAITAYDISTCSVENASIDPARFDGYKNFGLSYDAANNVLTYQGKRVRIFEDTYPVDDQSCTSLLHVDDEGTIDVQAERDMTKKSHYADGSDDLTATLTGLYVLPDAEFAARRLNDWTQTETGSTAASTSEGEMTIAGKEAFYAPYAAFGLSYDAEADALSYRGQRVRSFTDIRQSNGESLEGGRFHGVMTQTGFDNGEVDIETIRDYSKPDVNGDGALIGIVMKEIR